MKENYEDKAKRPVRGTIAFSFQAKCAQLETE